MIFIEGRWRHTEEVRLKNSLAHKGKIPWNKGIPCSEEDKLKISLANKGQIPWNKGIPQSEEAKIKNSLARKGKRCGKDHPNWRGGTSFLPYCPKFNKNKREEIREKYGRKCFLCNKLESENNNRCLSVHHIDYDKDQGCNGKTFELVPLCGSCHIKTNRKRDSQQIMIINKLRGMNGSF